MPPLDDQSRRPTAPMGFCPTPRELLSGISPLRSVTSPYYRGMASEHAAPSVASNRPPASSPSVRSRMSTQRRRDTAPEQQVRKCLHARGVRFRTDVKLEPTLRTRADIAWRGLKFAVFIDGCFWHGCPEHATRPTANAEWWAKKLDANAARDRRTDSALTSRGWTVRRYWEHEPPDGVANDIERVLTRLRHRSNEPAESGHTRPARLRRCGLG